MIEVRDKSGSRIYYSYILLCVLDGHHDIEGVRLCAPYSENIRSIRNSKTYCENDERSVVLTHIIFCSVYLIGIKKLERSDLTPYAPGMFTETATLQIANKGARALFSCNVY